MNQVEISMKLNLVDAEEAIIIECETISPIRWQQSDWRRSQLALGTGALVSVDERHRRPHQQHKQQQQQQQHSTPAATAADDGGGDAEQRRRRRRRRRWLNDVVALQRLAARSGRRDAIGCSQRHDATSHEFPGR